MQSKKLSFIESVINVMIGFVVAISAQVVVFPLFDIYISFNDNLLMAGIFTVVSIARSYVVRRLFNRFCVKI